MALTSGKIAEVMFGAFVETYTHQGVMLDLIDAESYSGERLQNAGNTVWYPVQQHRPILNGFDLTGQEQDIIEETVPISLGQPNNDFIQQRIDDMRDMRFWERAGVQSAMQQMTELNSDLARLVVNTGSLFFQQDTSTDNSGFNFASQADTLLTEREVYTTMGKCMLLNPRDQRTFATDLAGRETLGSKAERAENAYDTGNIGEYVAGLDIYRGSFLPNVAGGSITETTVSANVSLSPEAGTVNNVTNTVTNIDYRAGVIPVANASAYAVGDYIGFTNTGTGIVESVGLASKEATGQQMSFKITGITGNNITVFPKPIAIDDSALTSLEQAYGNINTQILSGATVNKLNDGAEAKANIFWAKDSIKMIGAELPWELFNEFGGNKVLSEQIAPGITAYMVYDGNIATANFRYRIFVWYGLSNFNPMANGVGLTQTS